MTELVGILNITPDSFSDGGKFITPHAALAQAALMLEEGASVIDIGAESTRPGATPLTPEEEWQRLEPVLQHLHTQLPHAKLSVDTRHAKTAVRALAYGIAWVNDVSGFTDPAMLNAVRDSAVQLVVMHHLTIPADKTITLPPECDPTQEVYTWLEKRIAMLEAHGIARSRIIADPGLGFGKTPEQSFALVRNIRTLAALNVPLLVGHSEKSFLSLLTDNPAGQRREVTQRVSAYLAQQKVAYLRVHAIAANQHAITTEDAINL